MSAARRALLSSLRRRRWLRERASAEHLRDEAEEIESWLRELESFREKQEVAPRDPVAASRCEHLDFEARVKVARLVEHLKPEDEEREPQPGVDAYAFRATIGIECSRCHAPFGFRVPDVGDLPDRPARSPDALELRAPLISPAELELLGPLDALPEEES